MSNKTKSSTPNTFTKLPLATVLIIPFTIIIVSVVTLTSYLSHRNSQTVVNDAAHEIMDDNTRQIELQLENLLQTPDQINQINATIIHEGTLDLADINAVSHYFWEIVQHYDSVTSIYFGYADGGLALGGREGPNGSLYIMQTDTQQANNLKKYATDEMGNPTELLAEVAVFDARSRPWFGGAVETHESYLTEPYLLSTRQHLAIASSLPVYDESTNELLGVLSVDIFIPHLDAFLEKLTIDQNRQIYIVEHTGQLVAVSTGERIFTVANNGDLIRYQAKDSVNSNIVTSATYIENELGGFVNIEKAQQEILDINGQEYYLSITPHHGQYNEDWLIVILVPKSEFLAQIDAQNNINFFIAGLAGLIAIAFGLLILMQVTRPMKHLTQAATALTKGQWTQPVPVKGVQEVQILGNTFNSMATQLRKTFIELEQRVAERTSELQTSQLRYQAIVEDQTELICRFTPDYYLTFANDAYCRYYNKTQDELIGHNFMPFILKEDQAIVVYRLNQVTSDNPIAETQHRVYKAKDEIRWVQWVNRAIYNDGILTELQGVGRDVTDIKKFQQSLQKALERETELSALKSHFISTVSHEFRTPLTIMMNASDILERYQDNLDLDKQKKYLQQIKNQIEHMTELLDNVTTMNKAEQGIVKFEPAEVDIVNLCKMIIREVKLLTKKPIKFDFQENVHCQSVIADKKLLMLIFNNLISNAVKYSEPESTVKINLTCDRGKIIFKVQDSGLGIPQESHTSIFDPFYRANNVDTIQGTGLGLAIVKQSVSHYGGEIEFHSELGQGTTFIVTLPTRSNQIAQDNK